MKIYSVTIMAAVAVAAAACGADQYAPCSDCAEARQFGGEVEACVCTYYCEADADCPTPDSGDASPRCRSLGDVVENGNSASCILPCDDETTCPDGMFCHQSECLGSL